MFYCTKCKQTEKNKKTDILCNKCRLTPYQRRKLNKQCIKCIETYDNPSHKCTHSKYDYDKIDQNMNKRISIVKNTNKVSSVKFKIVIPNGWV